MGWTLTKKLQAIFLDFTIAGERVITEKEFQTDGSGRKYLSKKSLLVQETREVLREDFYSPSSRRPYATHINRSYMLA